MPQISVIVPVYNAEKYLCDCVESILTQSFRDLELILVDDGSTDQSGQMCDQLAAGDERIRVLHQVNQGQAAARNHALDLAAGEWICFVDSDDMIHPQMLEVLYNAVRNTEAKISMCSNVNGVEPRQDFYRHINSDFSIHSVNEVYLTQLYECGSSRPWIVCGKLIRKEIVKKYPFTAGRIFEDNAVCCRWLYEAHTVADIDEELYFYRMTPVSTMRGGFNLKKLDYLWALEEIIDFYKEVDYPGLRKRLCAEYLRYAISCYRIVWEDLRDKKTAHLVRRNLQRFLHQNKDYISASQNQKMFIFYLLHPNISRLHSYFQTAKNAILRGIFPHA